MIKDHSVSFMKFLNEEAKRKENVKKVYQRDIHEPITFVNEKVLSCALLNVLCIYTIQCATLCVLLDKAWLGILSPHNFGSLNLYMTRYILITDRIFYSNRFFLLQTLVTSMNHIRRDRNSNLFFDTLLKSLKQLCVSLQTS